MYYPYLRGKQYELLLLRENAKFIKENNIHPIIEPVKDNFAAIKRALNELNKKKVEYVLIANPQIGDYKEDSQIVLSNLYEDMYIHHFISDSNRSEKQEIKFTTAINKLSKVINQPRSKIYKSNACKKFLELRKIGHYPGLGIIKKISMQHHIELIADYLKNEKY
jgi:hypothetical protein